MGSFQVCAAHRFCVCRTVISSTGRFTAESPLNCDDRDWFDTSKRVSLVAMIKRYCFTNPRSVLIALAMLLAAGCAAQPDKPASGTARPGPESATEDTRLDRPPTDPDVMYRVFAGEFMGAEGDLEKAADEYLEAAMESNDPEIAERATRIAVAARAWQHAAMAGDRWALLQPESLDAREIAARAMILVGDYTGAEHQMSGIIELMSHDQGRAWSIVASLLAAAGNPDKANRMLQRLVEEHSAAGNADALFAQSQLAARTGDLPRAAELAGQAVEAAPGRGELLAWAGRLAVNLGDEAKALALYHEAWSLLPENRPIAMAYAELLRRSGDIEGAQETLATLPDTPGIRFARIAFALESELPELAESIYREFEATEYPDPLEKAFQAAQSAELLGQNEAALEWYAQVGSGERALVSALRRAFLLAGRGDVQDARNLLASIRIRREPVVMKESFIAEGQILLEARQPGPAFDLLTEALEMMPGDTQLMYSRALVAVQLKKLEIAEQDLRAIIAEQPQNAAAMNALGYTLADLTDRFTEAEVLIRAAYLLQPEEASVIDSMGWIAYRLGQLEEAERFLRDAWNRENNAEIAAHLGEVLWMADRRDEAEAAWRDGLLREADNEVLLETMTRFGIQP